MRELHRPSYDEFSSAGFFYDHGRTLGLCDTQAQCPASATRSVLYHDHCSSFWTTYDARNDFHDLELDFNQFRPTAFANRKRNYLIDFTRSANGCQCEHRRSGHDGLCSGLLFYRCSNDTLDRGHNGRCFRDDFHRLNEAIKTVRKAA